MQRARIRKKSEAELRIRIIGKEELVEKVSRAAIILIFFNSLGFPGKMTEIIGSASDLGFQYFCFLLEILLMVFVGTKGLKNIAIIDIDRRFFPIYLYISTVFIVSMAVTSNRSEQIITCIRLCVTALFAIWISKRYSIEELIEDLCKAQWLIILCLFIMMILRPNSAFVHEVGDHDFVGIMKTKNNMAAEASLGIMMFLLRSWFQKMHHEKTDKWTSFGIVIQAVLLVLCNATGSLIGAIIAFSFLMYDKRNEGQKRIPVGVAYAAMSPLFPAAALTIIPIFEPFLNAIGKDATLTGRIPLWRQIVNIMTHYNTFTGYGFGMAWRNHSVVSLIHSAFGRYSFMGNMATGCHNVILELWLNIGLIGIAAYLLMYLFGLGSTKELSRERYLFCGVYTILFLFFGLTERSLSPYDYHTLLMFLSIAQGCIRKDAQGLTAPHD